MPRLPNEMIEHILSFTDIDTCIDNKNIYSAKKIYRKNPDNYPLRKYVKSRNLKMVNFLINDVNVKPDSSSLNLAVMDKNDNVDMVKCIHKKIKSPLNNNIFNNAVSSGNIKVIKYLHKEANQTINGKSFIAAILSGNIDTLKNLYKLKDFPVSEQMVNITILHGTLDILKYFHEEKKFPLTIEHSYLASDIRKDKNIVKYIKSKLKLNNN